MPEPIKLQLDGTPFKPGQILDPTMELKAPLHNVPGVSLSETNTRGAIITAGGTPLVSSSTPYRKDVTDLGGDIAGDLAKYGIKQPVSDFDDFMEGYGKDIEAERKAAETRKTEDVAGIQKDFTTAEETLKMAQEDALAQAEGRTRIGGFFTQMEAKEILNMQRQHRLELAALTSKKVDTIQAAQRAYEDKNFELAKDLRKEAKDYEQDIYNRKKDFYNFVTKAADDKRTATKQVRDDANKRIEDITKGIQDGTIDPKDLNPGERAQLMKDAGFDFDIFDKIAEQAKKGKVVGSPHIDTKTGSVNLLIKKPDGTYEYKKVGQVTPSSVGTEAENKRVLAQKKASALAEAQGIFTKSESAGGLAGTDGKIAVENYRATMQLFADKYSMTPKQFMTEFPPERFLSSESLKKNSDLTTGKTSSIDDDSVEKIAQNLLDDPSINLRDIPDVPAGFRSAVSIRKGELEAERIEKEQEEE